MTQLEKITEAQRLLAHARSAKARGADNLPYTEVDRNRYGREITQVSWEPFVDRADLHYFVARILTSNGVAIYGYFSAQQCVENYLKAYLRFVGQPIPQTHSLPNLLAAARTYCADVTSFLHSDDIQTICDKYNPFNELARYPVQKSRPRDGKYIMFSGEEVILDYFVFKMREILSLAATGWDILTDQGHFHLEHCKEFFPKFYALFTNGNLNFEDGETT